MDEPKRRGRPPKVKLIPNDPPSVIRVEDEDKSGSVSDAPELVPSEVGLAAPEAADGDLSGGQQMEPVHDDVVHRELSPAQVVALDLDYDGNPGGSRPVASLTDLQRQACISDAIDAYEGQEQIKRTDGFNRTWTFQHDILLNKDVMLIRCDRGPVWAQRLISSAVFNRDVAEQAIRECDVETER